MTNTMEDSLALVPMLDPERDYGDLTIAEIEKQVRAGVIRLREGAQYPQIVDIETGKLMKGSDRPAFKGDPQHIVSRKWFASRAEHDRDAVYDALTQKAKAGNVQAMKVWLSYYMIEPAKLQVETNEAIERLMESFQEARQAKVVVIEP